MDGRGHAVLDNYCFGRFLPQESNYNITSGNPSADFPLRDRHHQLNTTERELREYLLISIRYVSSTLLYPGFRTAGMLY